MTAKSRKRTSGPPLRDIAPLIAIRKFVYIPSLPSLSTIIWGSLSIVGDILDSLASETTRAQRELALLIEQRKLLLSLRLEHVSHTELSARSPPWSDLTYPRP